MTKFGEPWTVTGEEDGDFVIWNSAGLCEDGFVANMGATGQSCPQRDRVAFDLDKDRAYRARDCVNELVGITDPAAFMAAVRHCVAAWERYIASENSLQHNAKNKSADSLRSCAAEALFNHNEMCAALRTLSLLIQDDNPDR